MRVSQWWQRRSLRARLAAWYAVAGMAICAACLTAALAAGAWRPGDRPPLWPALVVGGAATLLLFGLAGYFIAGRALAPVKEMVERTRRLSAKSLNERLPVANPHDELGELATVFNETLQQLENSFAELKRFTADVSHELRTPLTAIRAVGEVACRERNPAILYNALGSILEEVGRMNQLIDRLLLLARADDDNLPVRLEAALVREALVEVANALALVAEDKQQRLELDCPDHLLAVFDPALLRLALLNLAQNAIRYSPPAKPITLRAYRGQDAVVIEVADQGPGIAPEHQQKIFERFYRVDKARSRAEGGVGLGLAIVKWSVERMGGTVELKSEVRSGSAFRLRLRPVSS
ncbi:MAG: sensor histidine kinase [Limisphaerales bacterium]